MFSVYIVDDDIIILEELINSIPWLDNGFEVIGSHTSSVLAVNDIKTLMPDVVFSDLKMPNLNGIEFVKAVKESGVDCEFVMISAYPSFENSRDFFRINGFDYILKPIQYPEIQIVLERLYSHLFNTKKHGIVDNKNLSPAFIMMTEYIQQNYNKKITLTGLGKMFGLNPNYICNLFAKKYNTTLTKYITDIRMKKAYEQMYSTTLSFKAIAVNCGYGEYYYFCKVFKEYYGVSPSKYLKDIREKEVSLSES